MMSEEKLPLVVWSGGMDSTAIVIDHFINNKRFDTVFVKVGNNVHQQKKELSSRKKILNKLTKKYGKVHRNDIIVDFISVESRNLPLIQPKVWVDAIMYGVDLYDYSEILFGYILSDHFWRVRDHMLDIFESYRKISHTGCFPEIKYPLEFYDKDEIIKEYYTSDETKDILNMVWTCEGISSTGYCYGCEKCLELNDLRMSELIQSVVSAVDELIRNENSGDIKMKYNVNNNRLCMTNNDGSKIDFNVTPKSIAGLASVNIIERKQTA